MTRSRIAAAFVAGSIVLSGVAVACDSEDEADVREGVEDVQETGEDVGQEVEDAVDDEVDTDGKDD
jgi:hypothetical protein